MFINKRFNTIIPHRKHAEYCGNLIAVWGNDTFYLPQNISLSDLVLGIANHDRGYDEFDTVDLVGAKGEQRSQNRIKYLQKSIERSNSNYVAELISLRHIQTLCSTFTEFENQINDKIDQLKKLHNINLNLDNIQTITNILDHISFDASIGKDVENSFDVFDFKSNHLIKINYQIKGSIIKINPRPFKISNFSLPLYGYSCEGYPERKELSVIVYHFTS